MPTVLRSEGLPAHVHVIGRGCEALFNLHCPEGPPELRENFGFSRRDVAGMAASLRDHLAVLCQAWERIHGTP